MNLARNTLLLLFLLIQDSAAKFLKGNKNANEAEITSSSNNNFSDDLTNRRRKVSVESDLKSDGYCWIHDDGKFCFDGSDFHSVTKNHDELLHQSFISGTSYSYSLLNTQKLRNDLSSVETDNSKLSHALKDEAWLDSMDGVKFKCEVVEDSNGSFSFDSTDKELLSTNADGSSTWRLQGWIVNVDSDGVPINVSVPTAENDDSGYEIMASITGIEQITDPFDTCDPDSDDGNESLDVTEEAHTRFLRLLDAHDPSISEKEFFGEEGKRRLDWITDLQGAVSNTQWCGAGTNEVTTPCPNPSLSYDFYADQACRRHDHGAKFETTWTGLPRLECFVDKDLIDLGGHNFAVQAAFGKYGGFMTIGCFNYESYNCFYWQGWSLRYGYCGRRWETNYGPWRYDGAMKYAGYKSRPKTCPYDTWMRW